MAILARVDVRAAGAVTARVVPRSADDDVFVAIAVDVADARDMTAECVCPILAAKRRAAHDRRAPNTPSRSRRQERSPMTSGGAIVVSVPSRLHAESELIAGLPIGGP